MAVAPVDGGDAGHVGGVPSGDELGVGGDEGGGGEERDWFFLSFFFVGRWRTSKGLLLSWSSPSSLLLSFLSFARARPEKLAVLVQLVEILQADSLASRGAKPKKSPSVFFSQFCIAAV